MQINNPVQFAIALDNVVVIEKMEDFPAAVGWVITLESKLYQINANLSTANRFTIPSSGNVYLVGTGGTRATITYTGSDSMFTGTDFSFLLFKETTMLCPNGSLFNIQPSTPQDGVLIFINQTISNCSSLGTIKNINTFATQFTTFTDIGDGMVCDPMPQEPADSHGTGNGVRIGIDQR